MLIDVIIRETLIKSGAQIVLCEMTENMQARCVLSRQARFNQ